MSAQTMDEQQALRKLGVTADELATVTRMVAGLFPGFGGGRLTAGNPISHAMKESEPAFALGVKVQEVVVATLLSLKQVKSAQPKAKRKVRG